MKNKSRKLFLIMFSASALLHGGILFLLPKMAPIDPKLQAPPERIALAVFAPPSRPPPSPAPPVETPPQPNTPFFPEALPDNSPSAVVENTGNAAASFEGSPEAETGARDTAENIAALTPQDLLLARIKALIDSRLVYPPLAKRRNIEGVVGVHLEISRTGTLLDAGIYHSSGNVTLDRAAMTLVESIFPLYGVTLETPVEYTIGIRYALTNK